MRARLAAERGGIVTGWLVKLLIWLTIAAVGLFEAGAVVITKIQVDGIAVDAAAVAGEEYHDTSSEDIAFESADAVARERDAQVLEVRVAQDFETIDVTVLKIAQTLFIHRIGFLKDHTRARSTQSGQVR